MNAHLNILSGQVVNVKDVKQAVSGMFNLDLASNAQKDITITVQSINVFLVPKDTYLTHLSNVSQQLLDNMNALKELTSIVILTNVLFVFLDINWILLLQHVSWKVILHAQEIKYSMNKLVNVSALMVIKHWEVINRALNVLQHSNMTQSLLNAFM